MASSTSFTPAAPSLSNNAVNVIFDSTRGFVETPSSTVVGSFRGRFASKRVAGIIASTTQNVTARLDCLKSDGTWETGVTSQTVTAGTPQPIDWLPPTADYRVIEVNGATGPSALTFSSFQLIDSRVSGA